jgi:hypothetical protein
VNRGNETTHWWREVEEEEEYVRKGGCGFIEKGRG